MAVTATTRRPTTEGIEARHRPARARAGLGQAAFQAGDHETAIEQLEAALAQELPLEEERAAADALGRAYAFMHRFEEALALFGRYLRTAVVQEDAFERIRFTVLLAHTLIDSENPGPATRLLSEVIEATRDTADPMSRARLYWAQSRLHASQNQPELASRYARLALSTLEATEHTTQVARAFLLLAHLENDQGNAAEALALFEQGYRTVAASGNAHDEGMFLLEKARALAAFGHAEEAASIALGATGKLANSSLTSAGRAYAIAASVFQTIGDLDKAIELYELAAEQLEVNDRHRVEVLTALGEIYEAQGRQDDALRAMKAALNANATRARTATD